MPTFRRAWLSACACRTQGVSSKQHRLQVLVLLQRAVQRGRALPLVEDPADLRVGVGDVPGQRVGVQPVERLLGALVAGTPSGRAAPSPRTTTGFETICTVRLWLCSVFDSPDLQQPGELELLRRRAADGQRQRLGHQRPPRTSTGKKPFLAVGEPAGRAHRLVAHRPGAVGHRQPPGEAPRLLGRDVEGLVGLGDCRGTCPPALPVRALASVSRTLPVCRAADWLDTLTVNSSTSPSRRNRGGLGWTIRSLAVTTLSSRQPAPQVAVVGEAEELPLGQGLGHGEFQLHLAVARRRAGAGRRRPFR